MRFNVKEQKLLAYQDKVQYTRFAYLVELIDKLSRKQKKLKSRNENITSNHLLHSKVSYHSYVAQT